MKNKNTAPKRCFCGLNPIFWGKHTGQHVNPCLSDRADAAGYLLYQIHCFSMVTFLLFLGEVGGVAKKSVFLRLLDAYSTWLVLQVLKHLMNYLQWIVLYTSVSVIKIPPSPLSEQNNSCLFNYKHTYKTSFRVHVLLSKSSFIQLLIC